MAASRLTGGGVFSSLAAPFADFLSETGQDVASGDRRFVSRNFLLDEGVLNPRADIYASDGGAAAHPDLNAWQDRHEEYLALRVFLSQPSAGPPRTLNPASPRTCPETFSYEESFSFGAAFTDLDLLRVVNARRVARYARVKDRDLLDWAEEVAAHYDRTSSAWQRFAAALGLWSSRLQLRPVYATFWEDQRDLFEPDLQPDWADKLRDRLGLLHFSPSSRGEIPILVFRYAVSAVPKHLRLRTGRPLAAPTVLDSSLSEAFCPAPKGDTLGRVLNLSGSADVPSREVVHPFFSHVAEHLFRVGTVRRPLPPSLAEARVWHLLALQDLCSRPDYAERTDGDLLI